MNSKKNFLPTLYPRDNNINKTVWYVEYRDKAGARQKRYINTIKFPSLQDRLQEADRLINEIQALDLMAPANGAHQQLVTDLQAVYDLKKPGWAAKSAAAYFTHLSAFVKWYRYEGCPAMDITTATIFLNHITSTGANATTRNNYRKNLKALWAGLIKFYKHRYQDNPFKETDNLPTCEKTKEWYRPHQVQQVLNVVTDPWQLLAIQLACHCFPRPNELRKLRFADIITETKRLRIESQVAKTKKTRYVPIPAKLLFKLVDLKNRYPAHYYIFGKGGAPGEKHGGRDTISKQHAALIRPLGFGKGFTFYSWKNTGAVKMMCMDKRNLRYISKCMGHHSLDMTDRYFQSLGVDEMSETILFPEI